MSKQIIPYNAALMKEHGKETGWHRKSGNVIVSQDKLGVYTHHVIVADENRVPVYDQVINAERGGGVFLPKDDNGKFGLRRNWRPQARDLEKYESEFPSIDYSNLGRTPWECPRGFAKANETNDESVIRETEEETGGSLVSQTKLPPICGNSTYNPHMASLASGVVDLSKKPKNAADPNEGLIGNLEFFSIKELAELRKEGTLYDSYTLAAFAAEVLSDPEKYFRPDVLS